MHRGTSILIDALVAALFLIFVNVALFTAFAITAPGTVICAVGGKFYDAVSVAELPLSEI